jgi:hypothetical protein
MLRPKITELGKLTFLEDGGLVCSVMLDEPPSFDAPARLASFNWGSRDPNELAAGDLVAHSEHGIARYVGRLPMNSGGKEREYLVLEFAENERLWVPLDRSYLVQSLKGAERRLTSLRSREGRWERPYCVEVLPDAYAWPGVGALPQLPGKTTPEAMAQWHQDCAAYQKRLHAHASYRRAAEAYFELQSRMPQPVLHWWVYRAAALRVGQGVFADARNRDEHLLLIRTASW